MEQPKHLTPLEQLCARKKEIKLQTNYYEQAISRDVDYLHHHAGSFVMSGVSSLLLPKSSKPCEKKGAHSVINENFSVMSLAKSFILPTALSLAQPLLLSWGLGKLPAWIINFGIKKLFRK